MFNKDSDSIKNSGRRDFFKSFAKIAGIAAMTAGGLAVTPSTSGAFFSFGSEIDPRWKSLVAGLKEYIIRSYVRFDYVKAKTALNSLAAYGIAERDVTPIQNVNKHLLSKDLFLTHYYADSYTSVPSIKLFRISRQIVFDGFIVEGRKRATLLGKKLNAYSCVMLGDEIFSTIEIPPVAMPYNLAPSGSPDPEWVIAIPYGYIHRIYNGFVGRTSNLEERIIEELIIHEITHIVHQTKEELLPFLAQFGYRVDDDKPMNSVEDLIHYFASKQATFHQAERLILERINNADNWYGNSGNATHLNALKKIRNALQKLAKDINGYNSAYPSNIMKLSDQQCHACMAFLYKRAEDRYSFQKSYFSEPVAA